MPLTLLSVNNYYYPRGGAEVVFLRHNDLLTGRGWSVVPFCMQHPDNRSTPWSGYFVEEVELGRSYAPGQRVRKGLKAIYSLEARRKVDALIDLVVPDICHAHNVYHHISPSVLGAVKRRGVPLVMTLHDLKLACPAYSMLSRDGVCERCRGGHLYQVALQRCVRGSLGLSLVVMAESYLHRLLQSYVRNVDHFVVPSEFYLRKLEEWGFRGERFSYVPNFVDASRVRPNPSPGSRFVYFGRLSVEKGVATLVRAVAAAGVGVDVIGRGPQLEELRALAEELEADVRFAGFLTGDALDEAISGARAVVLPSEWYENAPLSVLEAYALGKPVIASSMGGLPELVAHGETGWIFDAGRVDELAALLASVRALPDAEVKAAGQRARDRVSTQFSPERYLENIGRVYGKLGVTWH